MAKEAIVSVALRSSGVGTLCVLDAEFWCPSTLTIIRRRLAVHHSFFGVVGGQFTVG